MTGERETNTIKLWVKKEWNENTKERQIKGMQGGGGKEGEQTERKMPQKHETTNIQRTHLSAYNSCSQYVVCALLHRLCIFVLKKIYFFNTYSSAASTRVSCSLFCCLCVLLTMFVL